MKVAIYSPYLDSFGGGEKYILTIAETLSNNGQVDVLLDQHLASLDLEKLKIDLAQRFNLDLSKTNFIKAPIGKGSRLLQRLFFLISYDIFFYLTDGSVPFSTAKKSFIHFQVPFAGPGNSLRNKIKWSTFKEAIFNSYFTKGIIEKNWQVKGEVIYPPVDVEIIQPGQKEKIILSVGRFYGYLKSKKHEEIIKAFTKLNQNKQASGWSLHLVGSLTPGNESYLEELKEKGNGLPIYFYPNLPYLELLKLYSKAAIYWHAAGFNEEDPAKMEHFGITTVEAMAAGAVPVVINKGGQPEIIGESGGGFLWDREVDLINLTLNLINNNKLLAEMSAKAIDRSKIFSKANFVEKILSLAEN